MAQQNISKADLARRLNKSRAWVTKMLSGRADLTVRALAEVAYTLNAELKFQAHAQGRPAGKPRAPRLLQPQKPTEKHLCQTRNVSKLLTRTAHVLLPLDVVSDIDKLVGKRGRSAFLTEIARDEIQRRQQREALRMAKGAWKDEDHPELKDGAAAWVRIMRDEAEARFQEIQRHRDSS